MQTVLFPARDYITGDGFLIRRCRQCGLARTTSQPAGAELDRYYPAGYYGEGKRYPAPLQRFLEQLYSRRPARLEHAARGERGRALDVGCGQGMLLAGLRSHGWQVTGTELSERSARYAREELGLDVRTGELQDLALPAASFDLVILWHVLEHVSDPGSVLAEVARVLRPGGTLLVAVPNFGSPEARWTRDRWFHLDVPRHLNHFDLDVLTSFLEATGFRVERTRYFAPEYDFFSATQTALNVLGVRQNLLYNLLRSGGARMLARESIRTHRAGLVATILLTPLLAALSAVWVPIAAWLRRGATVAIIARRDDDAG